MLLALLACADPAPQDTAAVVAADPCTLDGLELDAVVANDDELLAALGKETRIGLMPGTYAPLQLNRSEHDGVHLIGACREQVVIQATGDFTVHAKGWPGHATFESMTLRDPAQVNLYGDGFGFTVLDVDLLNAPENILATQNLVVVDIQDSRIAWPDTDGGNGISMFFGPELTITNLEVEAPLDLAFVAEDLDKLEVRGLRVTDRSSRGPRHGSCAAVLDTHDVVLEDLELLGCDNMGLYIEDSTGVLRDSELRGTRATGTNLAAPGLVVDIDSDWLVQDTVIAEAEGPGALVHGQARFERTRFEDNHQGESNTLGGAGVELRDGAQVVLSECDLQGNTEAALVVRDDSTAVMEGGSIGGTVPGATTPQTAGVYIDDGGQVVLEGVRIEESDLGVALNEGTLEASGLDLSCGGPALLQAGGVGTLTDTRIQGGFPIAVSVLGGRLEAHGLDIRDLDSAVSGAALYVQGPGELAVTDAHIQDASASAALVWDQGLLQLDQITITGLRPTQEGHAYGVVALDGGTLEATDLTLSQTAGIGVFVDRQAQASLDGVSIDTLYRTPVIATAYGMAIQTDSVASITDYRAVDVQGPALSVVTGAVVDAQDVDIQGSTFAGVVVAGAHLALSDATVLDTLTDPDEGGGIGLYTSNRSYGDGSVVLEGVALQGNDLAGLYAIGQDVSLDECDVAGGDGVPRANHVLHGDAVFAALGSEVTLTDTTLRDARTGAFLHTAAVHVDEVIWSDNAMDLHMQACDGAPSSTGDLPEDAVCPEWDSLWLDLEFAAYVQEEGLDL